MILINWRSDNLAYPLHGLLGSDSHLIYIHRNSHHYSIDKQKVVDKNKVNESGIITYKYNSY